MSLGPRAGAVALSKQPRGEINATGTWTGEPQHNQRIRHPVFLDVDDHPEHPLSPRHRPHWQRRVQGRGRSEAPRDAGASLLDIVSTRVEAAVLGRWRKQGRTAAHGLWNPARRWTATTLACPGRTRFQGGAGGAGIGNRRLSPRFPGYEGVAAGLFDETSGIIVLGMTEGRSSPVEHQQRSTCCDAVVGHSLRTVGGGLGRDNRDCSKRSYPLRRCPATWHRRPRPGTGRRSNRRDHRRGRDRAPTPRHVLLSSTAACTYRQTPSTPPAWPHRSAGGRAPGSSRSTMGCPRHPYPAAVTTLSPPIAPCCTTAGGHRVRRQSAGGGLAVATLVNARDHGLPLPAAAYVM